jgi:gliding motility-associated-like protein
VDILFADSLSTDILITPESCYQTWDATAEVNVTSGIPPFQYYWSHDPNLESPIAHSLGAPGPYLLEITDGNGCNFPFNIEIPVNSTCLIIPTAITPNGDGTNDQWYVNGLDQYPLSEVTIFNCWGQVLYSAKQGIPHWDGTFENKILPVADYYFLIELNNGESPLTGTVTIKY